MAKIQLNGKKITVKSNFSIFDLLKKYKLRHKRIAIEYNGEIVAKCDYFGKTGIEMEALTAVSVAALTIYDMCKSVDKNMSIGDIRLTHKSGGKSGIFNAK